MRAILQVRQEDISEKLLQTIKTLILQNTEVLIQPQIILEEYDNHQTVNEVMLALKQESYSSAFLNDLQQGLKTSSAYADNEHQTT